MREQQCVCNNHLISMPNCLSRQHAPHQRVAIATASAYAILKRLELPHIILLIWRRLLHLESCSALESSCRKKFRRQTSYKQATKRISEQENEEDEDTENDEVAPFTTNDNDLIPIEIEVPIIEESINRPQNRIRDVVTVHNRVYRHISKPYDALKIGPFRICGQEGTNLFILESMDGFRFNASVHECFIHHYHPPVP